MLISIGHQHFVANNFIVEILKPDGECAMRMRRQAAARRMLINAAEGRRIRSMIKLTSGHIVLSAISPATLESRRTRNDDPSFADPCMAPRWGLHQNMNHSKPHGQVDRRKEPDRRRFSYTAYIPERRKGVERRSGSNDKNGQIDKRRLKSSRS